MNKKLLATLILVWMIRILLHATTDFSLMTEYYLLFGSAVLLVFISWIRKRNSKQSNKSEGECSVEFPSTQEESITSTQYAAEKVETSWVRERKYVHGKSDENELGEVQVTTSVSGGACDKLFNDITTEPDSIFNRFDNPSQKDLSQPIPQTIESDKIQSTAVNQQPNIMYRHEEFIGETLTTISDSECIIDKSLVPIADKPIYISNSFDVSPQIDLPPACSISNSVIEPTQREQTQSTETNRCTISTYNSDNVFGDSPEPDSILDKSLVYIAEEADYIFIKSCDTSPDENLIKFNKAPFSTLSQSALEGLDAKLHEDLFDKPHATTQMLEEITLTDLHKSFHGEDELSTTFVDGQISYELSPSRKKNLHTAPKSNNEKTVVKRQISNSESGCLLNKSLVSIEAEPDYVFNKTCNNTLENLSRSTSQSSCIDTPMESKKDQSTQINHCKALTHPNNQVFGDEQITKPTLGCVFLEQNALQVEPSYVFGKSCDTAPEKSLLVSLPICADESEHEQKEMNLCTSLAQQNLKPFNENINLCFNTSKITDQILIQTSVSTTSANNSNNLCSNVLDLNCMVGTNEVNTLIFEEKFDSTINKGVDNIKIDSQVPKILSEIISSVSNTLTASSSSGIRDKSHMTVTSLENNIATPVFDITDFNTPFTKNVDRVPPCITEIDTPSSEVSSKSLFQNENDGFHIAATVEERIVHMPMLELVGFDILSTKVHQTPPLLSGIAVNAVNMPNSVLSEDTTHASYSTVTESSIGEPKLKKNHLNVISSADTDQVALRPLEIVTSERIMQNQNLSEATTPHAAVTTTENNELTILDVIDMVITPPDKMFNDPSSLLPQKMTTVIDENEFFLKNKTDNLHTITDVGEGTSAESMINQMFIFEKSFIKSSYPAPISESVEITRNTSVDEILNDITEKLNFPVVEIEGLVDDPERGGCSLETIPSTKVINQATRPSFASDKSEKNILKGTLSNMSTSESPVETSVLETINSLTTSSKNTDKEPPGISKITSTVLNGFKQPIPENVEHVSDITSSNETTMMPPRLIKIPPTIMNNINEFIPDNLTDTSNVTFSPEITKMPRLSKITCVGLNDVKESIPDNISDPSDVDSATETSEVPPTLSKIASMVLNDIKEYIPDNSIRDVISSNEMPSTALNDIKESKPHNLADSSDDAFPTKIGEVTPTLIQITSVVWNDLKESIHDNVADASHVASTIETNERPYTSGRSEEIANTIFSTRSAPEIHDLSIKTTLNNGNSIFTSTKVNATSNASMSSNPCDLNRISESDYILVSASNNFESEEKVAIALASTASEDEIKIGLSLVCPSLKSPHCNGVGHAEKNDLSRSPLKHAKAESHLLRANSRENGCLRVESTKNLDTCIQEKKGFEQSSINNLGPEAIENGKLLVKSVTNGVISTRDRIFEQSSTNNLGLETIPLEFIYPCLPRDVATWKNRS